MEKINKHMKGQKQNPAEEFRLTNEDEFKKPSLEEVYWKNPNSARGTIAMCTQARNELPEGPRPYETSPIKVETRRTEGI